MWLRHCFQEQTPVGIAYEKNIVDNLRVGDICVRQQERGGRCGNYPIAIRRQLGKCSRE